MPYANSNGVRIHYEVEGQGAPLVLQHGFSGNLEHWKIYGYTKELSCDYQLILVDARGHGLSDKSHNVNDYADKLMVDDVVAVLDDLGVQKTYYFGYSMGGRIGFHSLFYAPDRFFSLILGGWGFPRPGHDATDRRNGKLLRIGLEQAIKGNPEKPIEAFVANRERESGPTLPAIRATRLANDAHALFASITAMSQPIAFDPKTVLPKVKLPCFVFAGEVDPVFAAARESANLLPNATFLSFPRTEHGQAFQQVDLVLPHVRKFLAETGE